MNELQRPLEVIETEINFYKNQTATGIIEIGKRLIEAKAQLPHGEWGGWLEEKVEFSHQHAVRFMRIAEEYGNLTPGLNLGYKKMWLLLDLPPEQRTDFIETNNVEDMTTRQLQEVIKAKKQADLKIEELEQKLLLEPKEIEVTKEIEVAPADYRATKAELEKLKNELELAELEKQQLQRRLKEETNPEQFQQMAKRESEARVEVHQLKKQLEAMEADSKTVEHKVKIASVNFCARVHNFLESVGGMVWINDYADSFTEKEKQEYFKALDAVEAWAQHVRNNFKENE